MSNQDPSPPPPTRLLAVDVFRGVTVAGMLLVNNPGSWGAIYEPLGHARWHGWTPTDLVFPFFLFIVGISTHLSIGRRQASGAARRDLIAKIVRRGLVIVLLGLALNAFPFYWWGKIPDVPSPTFGERVIWRFEHLRFPGVLQRIGIVYLVAGLVSLNATRRRIMTASAVLLVGYWLLLALVPVPGTGTIGYFLLDEPEKNLAAWTDRLLLGTNHLWSSTKTWDPEGPLSTLPAIATALLGVLAGRWITDETRPLEQRVLGLYGAGSLAAVAGQLWGWVFPINKNLWTSSYAVFTAGFACIALATSIWLIDMLGYRRWSRPFVPFGINPLLAFVGSGVMARLIGSLIKVPRNGKEISLQQLSYQATFQPWFPPRFASLLWGLTFVAFWYVILLVLERRKVVWKV